MKSSKPMLLEVRFAGYCQRTNLPVHDEITTEIESRHLETFIAILQNNFISAETNNKNLELVFCIILYFIFLIVFFFAFYKTNVL